MISLYDSNRSIENIIVEDMLNLRRFLVGNAPQANPTEESEILRRYGVKYTKKFVDLVERLGYNFMCSVLFGSVARGCAGKESDIDLLFVIEDMPADWNEKSHLLRLLRGKTGDGERLMNELHQSLRRKFNIPAEQELRSPHSLRLNISVSKRYLDKSDNLLLLIGVPVTGEINYNTIKYEIFSRIEQDLDFRLKLDQRAAEALASMYSRN